MKKFLLVLGMVTCLFGMTACGAAKDVAAINMQIDEESLIAYADQVIDAVNQIVAGGMQAQYASDSVISAALTSWESAMPDLGTYQGITEHVVTYGTDNAVIDVTVDGSDHDAVVTITLDGQGNLTGIVTNITRSMGELMINAGLNTLLGMGTVFVVLILISLLISCFKFIPALQEKFSGKKKAEAAAVPAPVVQAAPIVEEVEEEDDCELIAVIAAAIAAGEGAACTDGFVVRSIKRRTGKWQKA